MSTTFHVAGPELWEEIEQLPNDQHPAIVFNSHITGLAVARNLGKEGIPVIALDRDGRAYGLQSKYVNIAAYCPNPLKQEGGSGGTTGHLTDDELSAIVRGELPTETLVDAVFDQDDSNPGVQLIKNGYGDRYVCPC